MNEVAIDPCLRQTPDKAAYGAADGQRAWRLVAIGLSALVLGLLLYLTDRPASHALLIPSYPPLSGRHWFGVVGQCLPSFVHAFAFSLFTAAALAPANAPRYGACVAWAAVDVLFELGQHPSVSGHAAQALLGTLGTNPLTSALARYFLRGTFDTFDLAATLLGAAGAALVLSRVHHTTGGLHAN